jgi:hypothetical protein
MKMCISAYQHDWVGNLQATLVSMVTNVILVKCQILVNTPEL